MESTQFVTRKSERGFTLVELAIVMIIIGLLIGGILKGQELIANAQIGATVSQVKAIDAATTTFRDKYDALPGDMTGIAARLSAACAAAACGAGGDGNGRLATGGVAVDPLAAPAGEGITFFPMLAAGDLIGGIRGTGGAAWGDLYPGAKAGGGFHAGFSNGGALGDNPAALAGHYLGYVSGPQAGSADDALSPNQAQRIDTKLDDGVPTTGSVMSAGNANCQAGNLYLEVNTAKVCDLAIRFQN